MEAIFFLLLVIIIAILITFKKDLFGRMKDLERQVALLQALIRERTEIKEKVTEIPVVKPQIESVIPPVSVDTPKEIITEKIIEPIFPGKSDELNILAQHVAKMKMRLASETKAEPKPSLSFFERYPDLEKFIGENLINKIGIGI